MRKRWLLVFATVAVVALGATGGVALAQGGGTGEDGSGGSLVSRVASILGLAEDDVQAAFDQAREEIHEERLQAKLDRLVEEGVLTQEQADEYKAWIDAMPEGLSNGPRLHGFGGHGRHGGFMMKHGMGRHGWGPTASPDDSESPSL